MKQSIFEPIKIKWGDEEKEIPADQVMKLIILMEDHINYEDMFQANPTRGKLANVYGVALRFAGFHVTTEEIYKEMFSGAKADFVQRAVAGIQQIIFPPEDLKMAKVKVEKGNPKKGKS
jgi:hypothetical protein